jgi:hypothetical protein
LLAGLCWHLDVELRGICRFILTSGFPTLTADV